MLSKCIQRSYQLTIRTRRSLKFRFKSTNINAENLISSSSSSAIASSKDSIRPVAYWLLGMGGLVAGMVTIGGITRLTRSGLSMTNWRLQGNLPPMNRAEWEIEFERYKQFPEFQQRKSMTLDEFKFIYFWEYGHRMFGRGLGFAFALPAMYFGAKKMIPRTLYPRLGLLFSLGGAQGLIGWWMVKSGLEMDPAQRQEIRVSPYRLATHLGMAFTTYTLLVWTGLDLLNDSNAAKRAAKGLSEEVIRAARRHRAAAFATGALVATTVISGAYVAGNDAGRAFNTWPKMGETWIPDDMWIIRPIWRNLVENTATVQFDHRMLAYASLSAVWMNYLSAIRGVHWNHLPKYTRALFHSTAGMSIVQVGLGITAILQYVPIEIAAIHQFGSLTLLTLVTGLAHSMKFTKFGRLGAGVTAAMKSATTSLK